MAFARADSLTAPRMIFTSLPSRLTSTPAGSPPSKPADAGYEPYFAENQSSLKGLHENILSKLNECSGFIAVMHPRGMVSFPGGAKHTRGSVWIEQEVAIAAFMTQYSGRNIEVAAFIHEDIKREGIRDLLHLNPISFRSDKEILEQLPRILGNWSLAGSAQVE